MGQRFMVRLIGRQQDIKSFDSSLADLRLLKTELLLTDVKRNFF